MKLSFVPIFVSLLDKGRNILKIFSTNRETKNNLKTSNYSTDLLYDKTDFFVFF